MIGILFKIGFEVKYEKFSYFKRKSTGVAKAHG